MSWQEIQRLIGGMDTDELIRQQFVSGGEKRQKLLGYYSLSDAEGEALLTTRVGADAPVEEIAAAIRGNLIASGLYAEGEV